MYFNPYCDCFEVVCNEEYVCIYIRAVIGIRDSQRIRFPLSNKHSVYLGGGGIHLEVNFPLQLQCSATVTVLSSHRFKHSVQKAIGYLCPASRETESGIYHTLQKVRQRADAASKAAGCPAASTLTLPTHILERKTKKKSTGSTRNKNP